MSPQHAPGQVRGQLDTLRGACAQLGGCADLQTLLSAVLSLGNHLNQGTMRGSASGAPLTAACVIPWPLALQPS
jgi:hypothetical protein